MFIRKNVGITRDEYLDVFKERIKLKISNCTDKEKINTDIQIHVDLLNEFSTDTLKKIYRLFMETGVVPLVHMDKTKLGAVMCCEFPISKNNTMYIDIRNNETTPDDLYMDMYRLHGPNMDYRETHATNFRLTAKMIADIFHDYNKHFNIREGVMDFDRRVNRFMREFDYPIPSICHEDDLSTIEYDRINGDYIVISIEPSVNDYLKITAESSINGKNKTINDVDFKHALRKINILLNNFYK